MSATSTVAATVRGLRRQHGLTLADLAARLTCLGHPIALNTLSKLETGARRITVDDLVALAAALDVTPHDLLHFERTPDDHDRSPTPDDLAVLRAAIALLEQATRR